MMVFILCLFAAVVLLPFFYVLRKLSLYNQSPLSINTFEGSNSPYHPSVKYRKEGFGGYEFIMSETPFFLTLPSVGDNYRDQFECPSIHYSHDGIHWEEVIQNPIDDLTPREKIDRDYFSDPDLVETPDGLEMWYRINRRYGKETNQENVVLLRKRSKDGIHWGEREVIADLQHADVHKGLGHIVISQTLLYEDGKYKCWFVDDIHLGKENICYSESTDGIHDWSNKRIVTLNGLKITPWHLHILRDGDVYWLTVYDHRKITLWKGIDETSFEYVKTLVEPSGAYGSFYSNNTYRACLTKISKESYRLYFSADDYFRSYIGVMEGISPDSMRIISIDGKQHETVGTALKLFMRVNYAIYSQKVCYYTKRIFQKSFELLKSKTR